MATVIRLRGSCRLRLNRVAVNLHLNIIIIIDGDFSATNGRMSRGHYHPPSGRARALPIHELTPKSFESLIR